MFYYDIWINNGVEAFGTEGKTITVNEVLRTADIKALAREIAHENALIPAQVAENVLQNFAKAACNLMSQGNAIQFKTGNDVAMRIYPDIKIKGGNINLARAKELMPDEVTDEASMVAHAGELVNRAGIVVRAYAECQQKFTEMLKQESSGIELNNIVEKAKISRTGEENEESEEDNTQNNTPVTPNNGGSTGGSTGGNTGSITPSGNNDNPGGGDDEPGGDDH